MSDDITHVVREVVKRCETQGVPAVSDILAALVARTIVYDNPDLFKLDAELELKGKLDDRKGESTRVGPLSARGLRRKHPAPRAPFE